MKQPSAWSTPKPPLSVLSPPPTRSLAIVWKWAACWAALLLCLCMISPARTSSPEAAGFPHLCKVLKTNKKQLILSVKYFGGSKLDNYDIADKLEGLFARNIQVKDRVLNISNVEPNFLTDEVGDMLDFLIYITYFDFIKLNNETCDNMQDIDLNMKG